MKAHPLPDFHYVQHSIPLSVISWDGISSHRAFPLLVRREFYPAGASTGEHQHVDFWALYAVRRGRGVHRINGQPFAITRGDVYLLPLGATHAYLDHRALEIDAFYFPPSLWSDDERAALKEDLGFSFGEPSLSRPDDGRAPRRDITRLHPSPEAWRETQIAIEKLRALWYNSSAGAALALRGAFFGFVWELLSEANSRSAPPSRLDLDAALGEAVRLCDEEFAYPWSVETLAARAFLSPRHFGELFARKTGQSPAMYLRSVRLERAKTLLLTTSLPVAEVARECGWNGASQFSGCFAQKFGFSPLAFRRQALRAT